MIERSCRVCLLSWNRPSFSLYRRRCCTSEEKRFSSDESERWRQRAGRASLRRIVWVCTRIESETSRSGGAMRTCPAPARYLSGSLLGAQPAGHQFGLRAITLLEHSQRLTPVTRSRGRSHPYPSAVGRLSHFVPASYFEFDFANADRGSGL
jgi:hypothetical protein